MLKTYKNKLDTIQEEINSMSQSVLDAIEDSYKALEEGNITALKKLDISEKKLLKKINEIDNLIVVTIALNSPEAKDLRKLIAFLKLTNILMGVGINIKDFAKIFRKTFSEDLNTQLILEYAIPLHKSTLQTFRTAVNIIDSSDNEDIEDKHKKVLLEESKSDDLYSMVEKNILKTITKNVELSRDYITILSALRKLEKIADKSVSIANLLNFAYIGGEIQS